MWSLIKWCCELLSNPLSEKLILLTAKKGLFEKGKESKKNDVVNLFKYLINYHYYNCYYYYYSGPTHKTIEPLQQKQEGKKNQCQVFVGFRFCFYSNCLSARFSETKGRMWNGSPKLVPMSTSQHNCRRQWHMKTSVMRPT